MSADRDALVSAALALRSIAGVADATGSRKVAVMATMAALRAEKALQLGGCRRCGGPVESNPVGRPRVTCQKCRPPRYQRSAKVPEPETIWLQPTTEEVA